MSAKAEALPTPESIAKYVKQNLQKAQKSGSMIAMMHSAGGQEIVREDDYKGHHVVVSTIYHITVDGQEVTGHLMLTNAGQVQYHGLPNHSFDSTVQLVRALIDNFPEDFDKKKKPSKAHGGMAMGGHGGHSGMSGMKMPVAKSASTASKKKPVSRPRGLPKVNRSKSGRKR
jgi:hypothetical protein